MRPLHVTVCTAGAALATAPALAGIPGAAAGASLPGVPQVRFGTFQAGWSFGPGLYRTSDGGRSWVRQQVPGHGRQVLALAATATHAMMSPCTFGTGLCRLGAFRQVQEDYEHIVAIEAKEHPEVSVIHQVLPGPPRPALLAAAADAQLVVVGARGRDGLDQLALGSVAQALLQHAPCPVGVVHPPWHRTG